MRVALTCLGVVVASLLTAAMLLLPGWERPPKEAVQLGYRGTGLAQIVNPSTAALLKVANALPEPIERASREGDKATDVYQNVKVLTDLSAEEFNRVMLAITTWVAPEQGCAYCHNVENLADDGLYTKVVARSMLRMTRHINAEWKPHVAATGVTCYTCHRGNPVPKNIWFKDAGNPLGGFAPTNHGLGHPTAMNGLTAMQAVPQEGYLDDSKAPIRVVGVNALPSGLGAPILATEHTYALMMNMSQSLGVNCGFCHNSRAFLNWEQSTPQRVTAWHGIQMTRDLNTAYVMPLTTVMPAGRLGPEGDIGKIHCATCHQGVNKPLYGVSMAKDFPELGGQAAP